MRSSTLCNDGESLRWRQVDWHLIPPDCRASVISFLLVRDVLCLDSAMSDKRLRQDLHKSYKGAVLPAFDRLRYTSRDDFKGLRWVMKAGVSLQTCDLAVRDGCYWISDASEVLHRLVAGGEEDLATLFVMKSRAKNHEPSMWTSTLHLAAMKGYEMIVRELLDRGADVNKADEGGWTPLHEASYKGNVEVARLLLDRGGDVNKAANNGKTP